MISLSYEILKNDLAEVGIKPTSLDNIKKHVEEKEKKELQESMKKRGYYDIYLTLRSWVYAYDQPNFQVGNGFFRKGYVLLQSIRQ